MLNHRSVCKWIGERHTKFNNVGSPPLYCSHKGKQFLRRWKSCCQKTYKSFFLLHCTTAHCLLNSVYHFFLLVIPDAMYVAISLSPRPERLTTTMSFRDVFCLSCPRYARAWADSSAGIIPSNIERSRAASNACLSVTAAYFTRPRSFKALCSGPTPG